MSVMAGSMAMMFISGSLGAGGAVMAAADWPDDVLDRVPLEDAGERTGREVEVGVRGVRQPG